MSYVSSPLTLPLLWLMIAPLWLLLAIHRTRLGWVASRLVDRHDIRPSTIDALFMATLGIPAILFLFALPSPVLAFHFLVGIFGPIVLGVAAEIFRTPASEQVRPPWYVGEGKPDWQPAYRWSMQNLRFSMFSIAVFVTAICVATAIGGTRWKTYQAAESKRIAVTNLIQELGGKVIQPRTVTLAGTEAKDEHLQELVYLDEIEELILGGTKISNDGMRHFAHVHQLEILTLSGTEVDDAGLEHLRAAAKLQVLHLRQTKVTGVGLRNEWKELKQLDLSRCPVTREGLERVAVLPDLVYLSLQETDVDDSLIDVLAKLRTKVLDLTQTKITREGFEKLESQASDIETIRWYEFTEPPPIPPGPVRRGFTPNVRNGEATK